MSLLNTRTNLNVATVTSENVIVDILRFCLSFPHVFPSHQQLAKLSPVVARSILGTSQVHPKCVPQSMSTPQHSGEPRFHVSRPESSNKAYKCESRLISNRSRNGQNLTVDEITSGIVNATNIDPDFILAFTQNTFNKLGVPLNGTIDLVDLDNHDVTEHDASLTRLDIIQGETLTVQTDMVGDMLNDAPWCTEYLNTTSLGRTRARRESESQAVGSPPLSDAFENSALGEAGLVLLLLGTGGKSNPDERQALKWQVQQWFDLEIFPWGWQKSPTILTVADDLNPIVGRIVYWQQYWASQFTE